MSWKVKGVEADFRLEAWIWSEIRAVRGRSQDTKQWADWLSCVTDRSGVQNRIEQNFLRKNMKDKNI